uniref:Cytochrome P450 82A4 n=1 Tax=Cajanus cajan TaxID=3821 RepID=A0A151RS09_CAJCA|nr:Cytochrome P450 82A4 [Cajanus cajan]
MRKLTASELLSATRFELLRDIRESEVKSSLKELYREWVERSGGSGELLVEMKAWFGDVNLNVILRMIAGKRYSGKGEDEQQVRRIQRVFREFFRLTGLFVVGDAIPFLGWLDLGGEVKEMKKTAIEIDSIVSEWLEEHRIIKVSGETAETEQDFIDVLLSVLNGVDLAGYDFDTVLKATCMILIAGATDTTTVTMIWALSLLLNNRHALKKVQDELDEHVGKKRLVNESDINKLVYLQAVVKETLRLYPAGPLGSPREFTENCTLGGYNIRAGTRFILNVWKLHRDPRIWSNPLEFQPERFLNIHKDMDVKGQHFELLPFGGGRRLCPGISFGLQMTHLALASLLQAFEITTPSNVEVDMSATFGLSNMKTSTTPILEHQRTSEGGSPILLGGSPLQRIFGKNIWRPPWGRSRQLLLATLMVFTRSHSRRVTDDADHTTTMDNEATLRRLIDQVEQMRQQHDAELRNMCAQHEIDLVVMRTANEADLAVLRVEKRVDSRPAPSTPL